MELRDKIAAATRTAMRERQKDRVSVLRLVSAAIRDREIAARNAEDGARIEVGDAEVRKILGRMIRQRQESARTYEEGGRLELAEAEREEIAVIEEFLPRQLDQAEIDAAIDAVVAETGAHSIRDMGRVMAALKARHMGQMDFAKAGPRVKARLA